MEKAKMIKFIIDNENEQDVQNFITKYMEQIEIAKSFIYINYFNEETQEWLNKNAQQVYNYLNFNNEEI